MSAEGSDPTTSPASSLADSILPTPDQDFSSRRASLSPQVVSDMSSPPILDTEEVLKPEVKTHEIIIPPPTLTVRADVRPNPPRLIGRQPPISMSTPSTKRNLTSSAQNTQRAPAPPPIMLRRPTGKHGGPAEDIPLATGSSTSSGPASPNRSTTPRRVTNGGGLNISGLPTMTGSVEKEEEEKDQLPALPDLLPSPRRKFFLQSDAEGQPKSPAWQSFEVDHRLSPGSPSTRNRPRGSVEMPFSPLSPNSNDKRFDPTPQHGIHTRNLSLFFPSPGQQHGRLSVPATPNFLSPEETHRSVVPLPAGSEEKKPFAGNADWRFGQPTGENSLETPDEVKRGKRRGHHHKHSLSHNFFSFLDPTQTNANLHAPSPVASPKPTDTPQPVPMPLLSTPLIAHGSPTLSPLPPSTKQESKRQLLASFGGMHLLLGIGLLVEGQLSGWRCLAGVGYLMVFDAIGVAVGIFEQSVESWRSLRRPYGTARVVALLHFSQSLFLAFAAVCIAKESIEQVVLGSGAHDHGGGHDHGQLAADGDERPFPLLLLFLSTLVSAFSGGYLRNHEKLSDAVGPLFLPDRYMRSNLVEQYKPLLGNPFGMTISGSSAAILLGAIIVPSPSLHILDSCLSLLMTVLTVALSYPLTIAFGHVLLQTAPPTSSNQMRALRRCLKDVEEDRRVLGLGTLRCWTIGAGVAPPQTENKWSFTTPSHSRNNSATTPTSPMSPEIPSVNVSPESPTRHKSTLNGSARLPPIPHRSTSLALPSKDEPHTPLVVSLVVHVHPDTTDRDILEVTKMAWKNIDSAVGKRGLLSLSGGGSEITVGVKRGWDEDKG